MKQKGKRIATRFLCIMFALLLTVGPMTIGLGVLAEGPAETVDITVSQTWNDLDNINGGRPASVTVYLMNGTEKVRTLTFGAAEGWKGVFTDVPRCDADGKEIHYTLQQQPVDGYARQILTGEQTEGYLYPTNVSSAALSTETTAATPVYVAGSSSWRIQEGLRMDRIEGSQIALNRPWDRSQIVLTEYDASGNIVPVDEKLFFANENGGSLYINFRQETGTNKYVTTDHTLKLRVPDAIYIKDGSRDGFVTDMEVLLSNIKTYKTADTYSHVVLQVSNSTIWCGGSGYYFNASGTKKSGDTSPIWQDVTLRIPGITEGCMMFSFTDVDIPRKVSGITCNESVGLKNGFRDTIYTIPLTKKTTSLTRTDYLDFKVQADGSMLASAFNGNDVDGTFRSGFVALGDFSEEGITLSSVTADNATEFFKAVVPIALEVTVDGNTVGAVGGSVSEQHGWLNRNYGEAKVITLTPNTGYHIDTVTLDGAAISLDGFDETGMMTVNSGYAGKGNTAKENVTLYQRSGGIVDIYLPAQAFVKENNLSTTRVDHDIDVSFAPNGIVIDYTLVGTAVCTLTGTKTWVCGDAVHPGNEALTLQLFQKIQGTADETAVEYVYVPETQLSWTGDTFTFTDLPIYDEEGNALVYQVRELPLAGYTTGYDADNPNHIINTVNQQYTDVQGKVTWGDNGVYPHSNPEEITVHLYRLSGKPGAEPEEVLATEAQWTDNNYQFENLPLFDPEGYPYTYSVGETLKDPDYLPEGGYYETSADDTGFNFIHTLKGETVVSGSVIWKDGGAYPHNNAEEFPVILVRQSTASGAVAEVVSSAAVWNGDTYTWNHLPVFDEDCYPYVYTVQVGTVLPDYLPAGDYYETRTDDSGRNFINTLRGTVTVSGAITWVESDAIAHQNADEVPLVLERKTTDSGAVAEVVSSAALWTDNGYSFGEQPKYDEDGIPYVYTVNEAEIPHYVPAYDGWEITNTYVPQEQTVTIHYRYPDGSKAAEDTVIKVTEFQNYVLEVPGIEGYTPDKTVLSGSIRRGTPVEETVFYIQNPPTGDSLALYVLICGAVLFLGFVWVARKAKKDN